MKAPSAFEFKYKYVQQMNIRTDGNLNKAEKLWYILKSIQDNFSVKPMCKYHHIESFRKRDSKSTPRKKVFNQMNFKMNYAKFIKNGNNLIIQQKVLAKQFYVK